MLDFTEDELILLVQDGYKPGYMMDIREGDLIAIPPVSRIRFSESEPKPSVKTLVVQRVMSLDASYVDDSKKFIQHTVITFIGINVNNLPEHCSYGNTYPCFIKREELEQ